MEKTKIYKYTTVTSAIKILENKSILLRNPKEFNDPFDCLYEYSQENWEEYKKTFYNFCAVRSIDEIDEKIIKQRKDLKEKLIIIKQKIKELKQSFDTTPFYRSIDEANYLLNLLFEKRKDIYKQQKEMMNQYEEKIKNIVPKTIEDSLITCFSYVNDSILMWSHYAKMHKGVCLEFERPNDSAFRDVIYQDNKPIISFNDVMLHILARDLIGKSTDKLDNPEMFNHVINPLYTKSSVWDYEKEIRCIYSKNNLSKNVCLEDGKYKYRTDYPSAIYLGCKVSSTKLKKLKEIAKEHEIIIYQMEIDKDNYAIYPKRIE